MEYGMSPLEATHKAEQIQLCKAQTRLVNEQIEDLRMRMDADVEYTRSKRSFVVFATVVVLGVIIYSSVTAIAGLF